MTLCRVKVLGYALILFLMVGAALAEEPDDDTNTNTRTKSNPPVFHVYDDIDLVSAFKVDYGKPRIVVRSTFPQLESGDTQDDLDNFNLLVSDFVNQKILEFTTEVEGSNIYDTGLPREKIRNDLYLDYATSFVKSGKNPIISVRFITQGYITGSAHPFHRHYVLNYNLHNGEEIQLESLFKPAMNYLFILSDYSRHILNQRLSDKQMIDKGTEPKPENFKNWNIKPNGLLITFDENQVAPYVYGAQTVLIPYSLLQEVINPDSPIMSCIKNKRHCASSSVLTGGFIDEAKLKTHKQLSRK